MAILDSNLARQLAQMWLPVFQFAPMENFFPISADEYLTHCSRDKWNVPKSSDRGSTLIEVANDKNPFTTADMNLRAGCNAPGGNLISTTDPNSAGYIGKFLRATSPSQDLFLDFGGWDIIGNVDQTDFEHGSPEHSFAFFNPVYHAMNPVIAPEGAPRTLQLLHEKQPQIYAEIDWGGIYPRTDLARVTSLILVGEQVSPDFPPALSDDADLHAMRQLDSYIALTYYLLYPITDLPPNTQGQATPATLLREGQWEAITLYFKVESSLAQRDQNTRPQVFLTLDQTAPSFAVYSQGIVGSDLDFPNAECQQWGQGGIAQVVQGNALPGPFSTAIVYVTAGTHKNEFGITAVVIPNGPAVPDPDKALWASTLGAIGGAMCGCCPAAAAIPALICCIIGILLLLIALILTILAEQDKKSPPPTYLPSGPDLDLAIPGGPSAGQAGAATTNFDLRVINEFDEPNNQPKPADSAPPSWWNYSGRWGVRTISLMSNNWDSGGRRVDQFGRSRAYWNTVTLVEFWSNHPEVTP